MSETATIDFPPVRLSAKRRRTVVPHVLVADADERSRCIRYRQLSIAGCQVSFARTGFEAIVKASCLLPDLILLDDSLADLDSIETGHLLATSPATAKIPVFRLLPGRRISQRALTRLRRVGV